MSLLPLLVTLAFSICVTDAVPYTPTKTTEVTTTTSRKPCPECSKPICPIVDCAPGYVISRDPCKCRCDRCVPKPCTTTCPPHYCPMLACVNGYEPQAPCSCECPKCKLIPICLIVCNRRNCVPVSCGEGEELIVDPCGCQCPRCETRTTISPIEQCTPCTPKPCPDIACTGDVLRDPCGCKCPVCLNSTTVAPPGCPTTCKPIPCPAIRCEGETLTDPCGCRCPKCVTPCDRVCPAIHIACPYIECPNGRLVRPCNCGCPICVQNSK